MSHTITYSKAQKEAEGVVVISDLDALTRACAVMKIPTPVYVVNERIGSVNGEKTATGYKTLLPGWTKPAVFNLETGDEAWDNWPVYGPDHIEVRQGRKRVGDGGQWGEIEELDRLRQIYTQQCDQILFEQVQLAAQQTGDIIQIVENSEGRKELLITHV